MLHDKNEFVKKVQAAIYSGCGMNPLVGSGASAASGIIMGLEFSDYLAYVVQQTVKSKNAWNLRKNDWPASPTSEEYGHVRQWALETFQHFYDNKKEQVFHVEYDGNKIKRIQPASNFSLSDHVNCPDPPANIRSSDFVPFDPSQHHVNATLRRGKRRTDRYEPLWLRPEQSPTSTDWIVEIGLRSLADWRATLRFLSRVKKEPNGRVILSRPNRSVVDRFNTYITADRQPNLAHKMLAALARPLRMRTVLTTNFDTLIEEAFLQSGHFLKKFFVSLRGRLPDPFLVRAQPSVIKLHGELLETRADYSLDGNPTIQDKRRFFSYFVDTQTGSEKFQSMLSHVLVLGYSGNDIRTIRMLQYLLDETAHFQPENQPKIFWICVSEGDVWRVNNFFKRYPQDRIVACQTDRPDLLLLELYQKIVRAIPVAGQTYEYNHNVPPSRAGTPCGSMLPSDSMTIHNRGAEAFNCLDVKDVNSILKARDALAHVAGDMLYSRFRTSTALTLPNQQLYDHFKIRDLGELVADLDRSSLEHKYWTSVLEKSKQKNRVLFFDAACGALEALSILHAKLSRSDAKRCLWFELADYINGDALLRDVLRSIALRTGRFQREHVTLHPLDQSLGTKAQKPENLKETAEELAKYFVHLCEIDHLSPGDWPVLIYGRDLAGSCINWQSRPWENQTWNELFVLIGALAMAGFPVLLAHSSETRRVGEEEKWNKSRDSARDKANGIQHPQKQYLSLLEQVVPANLPTLFKKDPRRDARLSIFARMRENVFQRCLVDVPYRKFVYAVCLFRQSRRPSALFYEAVQPCGRRFNLNGIDNDVRRYRFAEQAILHLETERVFYLKAGGSSWMHRDIRVALHMMLDRVPWVEEKGTAPQKKKSSKEPQWHSHSVARVHFWIGDWYEKAFYSTGFSKPVFEALHHYFQAARLAPFALPKGLAEDSEEVRCYRFLLMRSAVNAMTKLLLVARPFLKLWMANLHGFSMFDLPEPDVHKTPYDHLASWLWPEKISKQLKFGAEKEEQLASCFQLLSSIIRDIQRAIRNEADIQIAPEFASGSVGLVAPEDNVRQELDIVLRCVYKSDKEWNTATSKLITSIAEFGDPLKKCRNAYKSCFPIGRNPASITEEEHAKNKGLVVAELGPKLDKLPALLAIVEAIAYAQMRRAKFCGHIISKGQQDHHAWRRENVRNEWLRVTRMCNLGIDWCKHLPPGVLKLDLELRVRLHSYYAVALANLDRFYEAHRHLTEAFAIQSKQDWASARIEQAKLSLRRAEVVLTEAHRIGQILRLFAKECYNQPPGVVPKTFSKCLEDNGMLETIEEMRDPQKGLYQVEWHQSVRECLVVGNNHPEIVIGNLRRLLVAMLDDAWFATENAEKALSGQSQSSLWWGRISLMKLRACGYQLNLWAGKFDQGKVVLSSPDLKMLAYRHRRINPQGIWRLFETARLNDRQSDPNMKYREFRLVRYVVACLQVFSHCQDEKKFVRDQCEQVYDKYCDAKYARKEKLKLTPELGNIFKSVQKTVSEAWSAIKLT